MLVGDWYLGFAEIKPGMARRIHLATDLMKIVADIRRLLDAILKKYRPIRPRRRATLRGNRLERDHLAMLSVMHEILTPSAVCLDIGANEGRVLAEMVRVAPEGRHYAFEPIPVLAESLRMRFPSVIVHGCALSDTAGESPFHHVLNLPGWSGLRRQEYPTDVTVEDIQVPLLRLDDVVPADVAVRFIKIDVEGAELQVLRGGVTTIRHWHPWIVFEYAEIHGLLFGTTPEGIYDYLTNDCELKVHSLLGSRRYFTRSAFVKVCRAAAASGYDAEAETNFVASPS